MEITSSRRTKLGFVVFFLMMILLVCRLFYIQIVCHEKFERMATSQYEVSIEGINTNQYYYFISKEKCDKRLYQLTELLDGKKVDSGASSYYVFRTECFDNIINNSLQRNYDAYVFKSQGECANENIQIYFWADAAGRLFVGEAPKKSNENEEKPLVQDVASSNVTQKA